MTNPTSALARTASSRGRLWLAVIFLPLLVQAAEVSKISVERENGRFVMHADSYIRAPVAAVRGALLDYAHLPRLNSAVKRVVVLERHADGGVRMAVVSEFQVLAIHLTFSWIQEVRPLPGGAIAVSIGPNGGDFREGRGHWHLLSENGGTRLIFDVDLTANFWIPPALGPWLLQRKLAEETLETAQGLERIAAQGVSGPRPSGAPPTPVSASTPSRWTE